MMEILRPSDGALRPGSHLDLNRLRLKRGERVLYEIDFGLPQIGTVDRVIGNWATIDGRGIFMPWVKHRIQDGTGEAQETELLRRLLESHALAPHRYNDERAAIVKNWTAECRAANEKGKRT